METYAHNNENTLLYSFGDFDICLDYRSHCAFLSFYKFAETLRKKNV